MKTYIDIIREYVKKYDKASSRSLARMIMKDYPQIFRNYEVLRTKVRLVKKELKIPSKPEIPEGIFNEYKTIEITGKHNILLLSDIHIPFHDKSALELAVNYQKKIDTIILNGDILDCYSLSKFQRDPRKRLFVEEIKVARKFFEYLRSKFKKARIIFKFGNHEERYQSYIYYTAPELFGINEIYLENILRLDNYGIEVYKNKEPIKTSHLYILHGHEYKGGSNLVSPSRSIYLKTKSNTIIGHYHTSSTFQDTSISGKFTTCWSTGCLCDLHPEYLPLNRWNLGFAIIETDKDKFNVNNFKIIGDKVYRA